LSPALATALPTLLAESPDPDSALLLFERLVSESEEIARLLDRHHPLAHYAIVVFGHSRFLGETLVQNPDLLQSLLRERSLDRSLSREELHEALARFRSRSFENDFALLLARFKRREYVRIMLRDVLKIAPLAETTAEISALADVLIEEALRQAGNQLQRHLEAPQHLDAEGRLGDTPFAILSLGKLGGNELNYSSDVDLLYIFGDGQEPPHRRVSSREYFIRLAQLVTETLSRMTREGAVFRIDLRLRPQGGEGELAVSLSEALRYYRTTAHDWERQALIKVRHSAGDTNLVREFIRGTQASVYTEQINFAAVKTALVAREKMQKKRRLALAPEQSAETINVKLDPGGIRDIEFLVQCLQRVYGGSEPWLRSGGTLFSLQKLHDKGHVSSREFHDLTSAYEFLRHLEHRLQLRQGQQTHRLPHTEPELRILQRSIEGYAKGEEQPLDLVTTVRRRMAAVAEIYQRVIYHQQTLHRQEAPDAEFELRGAPEPAAVDHSNQQLLERLAADSPVLCEAANRRDLSHQARKNLYRFLSSAFTSSQRYGAILRHPGGVVRALALFESSEYLTGILVRHPEEVATLGELGEAAPRWAGPYLFEGALAPLRKDNDNDPVFAFLASSSASYGEKLALLRQHYRHRVLASGAKDITEERGVFESFAETTAAAEDAIAAAFSVAGAPEGLAVMALGRLGSREFDVLSDADVLFVCEDGCDRQLMTRAAEQMVQVLAAYTREGMVFPVDPRLRPRGGEGELLVTPAQLAAYFKDEAQAWEALMYTKLRFVAGSRALAEQSREARKVLFRRFAADPSFLGAVREMRTRLETEALEQNFKTSPGAVYDIDFLSSFLLVKQGSGEQEGSLRDRLWRCAAHGFLEKADAAALDHAAELLRTVEHVVRLVVGRARKWLPATEHAKEITAQLTSRILRQEFRQGLETEILQTCSRVRGIYERVLVLPRC
jgi:glutamate-ammonia-ligase adenylyltransferase